MNFLQKTDDELKTLFKTLAEGRGDASPRKMDEIVVDALKVLRNDDPKVKSDFDVKLGGLVKRHRRINNLKTSALMLDAIDPLFRDFAQDFYLDLIDSYQVTAPQDKARLQMAVIAFCRYQSNQILFELNKRENASISFFKLLSKDSDKAFHQFTALTARFDLLKQPQFKINVHTKNTFLAENQQNHISNPCSYEINDPQ